MKTRVVNIHHGVPYDVYIGRAGKGHDGYFGNPFTLESCKGDRELCLRLYEDHFYKMLDSNPEFLRRILELRGKVLGCFCSPKLCHGHVIADFLNNHWPWSHFAQNAA